MKKSYPPPRCTLCNDIGFAILWHQSCIDHYREHGSIERRAHRSCAVACSCRAGDNKREKRQSFTPSLHCYYQTLAEERELMLAAWCDEHFAPVRTYQNGIEVTEFR